MTKPKWEDNSIQFPRLLAEIHAQGLYPWQLEWLAKSMDLTVDQVRELFARAEEEWERIKP